MKIQLLITFIFTTKLLSGADFADSLGRGRIEVYTKIWNANYFRPQIANDLLISSEKKLVSMPDSGVVDSLFNLNLANVPLSNDTCSLDVRILLISKKDSIVVSRDYCCLKNGVLLFKDKCRVDRIISELNLYGETNKTMRNFTFNSGDPFPDEGYQVATQEEITELQNLIGVDIPQDFIDFHLTYGSCNTKECHIMDEILSFFYPLITPIMDFSCASEFVSVKQLLNDYILEKETYDEPVHEYLRSAWLPFGDDPFGNYFCIKLTGEDQGSVHLLLPEFSADEKPFKFLANSFEEFLNALTLDPDGED